MQINFKLVVFEIDKHRYALHLESVVRVVRMVEISPLPRVPDHVMGMINLQGQIIPVINMRRVVNLPEREIRLNDQLIIVHSARKTFALYVDSVIGNTEKLPEEITKAGAVYTGIQYVEGIIKFEDGLTLIHNPEKFLSDDELVQLQNLILSQRKKTAGKIKSSETAPSKRAKRTSKAPKK